VAIPGAPAVDYMGWATMPPRPLGTERGRGRLRPHDACTSSIAQAGRLSACALAIAGMHEQHGLRSRAAVITSGLVDTAGGAL